MMTLLSFISQRYLLCKVTPSLESYLPTYQQNIVAVLFWLDTMWNIFQQRYYKVLPLQREIINLALMFYLLHSNIAVLKLYYISYISVNNSYMFHLLPIIIIFNKTTSHVNSEKKIKTMIFMRFWYKKRPTILGRGNLCHIIKKRIRTQPK